MDNSMKAHNDSLMNCGYEILQQCDEKSIPCFLWGGGAIYHLLGGRLDYRIMSDLEFFIPKKADKDVQNILTTMGFYPNKPFNMMQNMSRTPRREYYRPNRELSQSEIEADGARHPPHRGLAAQCQGREPSPCPPRPLLQPRY